MKGATSPHCRELHQEREPPPSVVTHGPPPSGFRVGRAHHRTGPVLPREKRCGGRPCAKRRAQGYGAPAGPVCGDGFKREETLSNSAEQSMSSHSALLTHPKFMKGFLWRGHVVAPASPPQGSSTAYSPGMMDSRKRTMPASRGAGSTVTQPTSVGFLRRACKKSRVACTAAVAACCSSFSSLTAYARTLNSPRSLSQSEEMIVN